MPFTFGAARGYTSPKTTALAGIVWVNSRPEGHLERLGLARAKEILPDVLSAAEQHALSSRRLVGWDSFGHMRELRNG